MQIKKNIAQAINRDYFSNDVKVSLDGIASGIWLWEEKSQSHLHFLQEELVEILGDSEELQNYILSLDVYRTSWRWLPHKKVANAR